MDMKRYLIVSLLAVGVATYVLMLHHFLSLERADKYPGAMHWRSMGSLLPAGHMARGSAQRFQLQVIAASQGVPERILKLDTWTGYVWTYSDETGKWLPVRNEPRPKAALEIPTQHFEVDALVEDEGSLGSWIWPN